MVTALYSPVFEPELAAIAASCMETGGLYLGMEDIGTAVPGRGNMGDLCYFIGLQSEDILSRVRETAREEDGIWYVDSPGLYFDLLELDGGRVSVVFPQPERERRVCGDLCGSWQRNPWDSSTERIV